MALDPASPLHRFRVDPYVARRGKVQRLVDLGVHLAEIPEVLSRRLLGRFAHEFLDPARAAEIAAGGPGAPSGRRALELDRWLRPECVRQSAAGCGAWLFPSGKGAIAAECVRLERRADLPALAIDLATMDDAWASSWPGVFVRFEIGRALVVTLDYEQIRCEVRPGGATPYR